ncbi:acyl-CoA-binding protein [Gymnopus androsaceus JB14]|uniref:Acyl-CoA-binding protein n=1 Tax=Gymnopus androsaceus JB14 TaxID=1447944 RepID=A0A6A4HPX1_9AGAR|nr:acyl-CoA-binding protein [Gymnopus androsaceus JB14]
MSCQARFDKAVEIVQNLPKGGPIQPSQDQQLFFYKHYKQATIGDVNCARPGMLDFTGKAKWDAWKEVEGMSQEDAQIAYVKKLLEVLREAGTDEANTYIASIESIE